MAFKIHGLRWRTRSDGGRVAYWIAPAWARRENYPIRTRRLWSGNEPTEGEMIKITAACRQMRAEAKELIAHPERLGNKKPRSQKGSVYFLRTRDQIKIGYTAGDVKRRMRTIQSTSGIDIELLGFMPGTRHHEQALHHRFSHLRARGEWFAADAEILAFVAENAVATGAGNVGERGNVDAGKMLK